MKKLFKKIRLFKIDIKYNYEQYRYYKKRHNAFLEAAKSDDDDVRCDNDDLFEAELDGSIEGVASDLYEEMTRRKRNLIYFWRLWT